MSKIFNKHVYFLACVKVHTLEGPQIAYQLFSLANFSVKEAAHMQALIRFEVTEPGVCVTEVMQSLGKGHKEKYKNN